MAREVTIEELRIAQQKAFYKKQNAYQKREEAWEILCAIGDRMDRANQIRQAAYDHQSQSWREYQSTQREKGPMIKCLNSAQKTAYHNMQDAIKKASQARESNDTELTNLYAKQGYEYKNEARRCVRRRRKLVDQCCKARAAHEPSKIEFARAKSVFVEIKKEYNNARLICERENSSFKQAKVEFNIAKNNLKQKMLELKRK